MLKIIQNPKGQVPAVDASLLPDNFAQIAKNCDLRTGRLKPLKDLELIKIWEATDLKTLHVEEFFDVLTRISEAGDTRISEAGDTRTSEDPDKWLYWTKDIKIVKAQLADGNNRIFYTGDGYPKQTDNTLMATTGTPSSTDDYRRLGVTPPSVTLTINGPYGTGDSAVKYSVSYHYTYVCKWAEGTEEESKPVAATAVQDVEGGEYLALSGFVKPSLASSGNEVTHFRVYRLNSSETGASYQLAKMRPGTTGATAVYDLPVADVPLSTTLVYDCDSTPDDLNGDLGEACTTTTWVAPPDNLSQIGQYQNQILAGFSGKNFCVSEPMVHYAWPTENKISLNYTPVAWGMYRGVAIIGTEVFPSIITGADSSTLMQETLLYNHACLSARGFVITDVGILYPSPTGLVQINESGKITVLTKNVLTKTQWKSLPPTGFTHADLCAFYYEDYYIGFWRGTSQGFIFNFKDDPYIAVFELTDTISHGCINPADDAFYLLTYIGADYFTRSWNAAAASLTLTFKSKKFIVPNMAFIFARIIGDQSVSVSVTFKVYGNGSEVLSKTISTSDIFRLSLNSEYGAYELEVSGKAEIDKVFIATSTEEIIGALS